MLEVSDSSKARSVPLIDLHAGREAAGRSSVDVFSSRVFFSSLDSHFKEDPLRKVYGNGTNSSKLQTVGTLA